jgi:replicase family protein/primase-like protein
MLADTATSGGGTIPKSSESRDPRYFDLSFWPEPKEGQTWVQARIDQVQAIEAIDRAQAETGRETVTYQMKAPLRRRFEAPETDDVNLILERARGLRQAFPDLVPCRPWCSDDLNHGLVIRRKPLALQKRYIQLDPPKMVRWLAFDIDRRDAHGAAEQANLPAPNFIAVNPENGHSLSAYLIGVPVFKFDGARRGPIEFLSSVERGYTRRLGADPGYVGLISKNPLHPSWRVDWQVGRPYDLGELADALDNRDMRPQSKSETSGLGRNCSVFNDARFWAYENAREFKRSGGSFERWEARLAQIASGWNMHFNQPLAHSEIRQIAKSIAKWTWRRFCDEELSRKQSFRGKLGMAKRWAGHVKDEPWKALGISKATYYRRKKEVRP